MALYLYQASYTAEAIAAQIKTPSDRIAIVAGMIAPHGAKIVAGGYSMGDYDVTVVMEAEDDETIAAVALALVAGGALRSGKTTKLLDGHQWVNALTKADAIARSYKPQR